ncbi:MAG: chloride channel protein, partial [Bacteroidales bacterium]|nr:chloride channel protein [Bacteroidales bacterium]
MSRILNLIQLAAGNASRWIVDRIGQRYFVILLSLVVGVASGIAAVTLKHTISFVKSFVDGFASINYNLLLLISPALGILISWLLVKYVIRAKLGHGITQILYAISQTGSSLPPHHVYSSILTSSFTIGFGGSVGAEAPIALTGAG